MSASRLEGGGPSLREVASAPIPTPYGEFQARAFEAPSGHVHLALVLGTMGDGRSVLTRLHSECLTGDALGSLRCDCGVQLRSALRTVAAEGRGVVLYLNGHEGRGIGLVDKLRAYVEQDAGADTVDANLRLGLAADLRTYDDAAAALLALGVRSVRLLSNNPRKAEGLQRHGITVESMPALGTAAHRRNRAYLETKQARFGHHRPAGDGLEELPPFILMRFVEGTSFRDLKRSGDTAAIAQAAYSAGETLAAIGRTTFPKSGWLAAGRWLQPARRLL